jgi:hypothetical protein
VQLTITEFDVGRAQIRSLATRVSRAHARHEHATRPFIEYDTHPRQPLRLIAVFRRRQTRRVSAWEIPAGHNFEVQHERQIFDMRKPSDEA